MAEQVYPEPTTGALIINPEGKLFLVKSHKWHDQYVVPGGHVELGETIQQALIREIKEETNLDIFDLEFIQTVEMVYDKAFWKKKHFIFIDYSAKTNSEEVILNDEAQDFVWVSLEEALKLPVESYTRMLIEKYKEKISK